MLAAASGVNQAAPGLRAEHEARATIAPTPLSRNYSLPWRGGSSYHCIDEMNATHPPIDLAERLNLILAGVREVAAARVGVLGPLIALLSGRLTRRGLRFAALLAAFRAGTLRAMRPRAASSPRPARAARPRLPDGFGWLIRRCGWQAACYGSQLGQLLAEPEMVALLRASPQAGRIFRPLCRMLAVKLPPELARKRRRTKPAASPDASAARAEVSCYRWRVLSVADEVPGAAPEGPGLWVVSRSRSGAAECDGGVSPPHPNPLRPRAERELRPNSWLPGEAGGSEFA
jgi:hypothetical protein